MFICQECNKSQPRKTKPHKVVTHYRKKKYSKRFEDKVCIDEGGEGYEIHREVLMCGECAP